MERHREFGEHMYAALNHRDFATFLEGVAEDVEFQSLVAEAEGDTFRGHDGVRRWWTEVAQALGGLGFELQAYAEEGNGLVTKVRVRGNVGRDRDRADDVAGRGPARPAGRLVADVPQRRRGLGRGARTTRGPLLGGEPGKCVAW